MCIFSSIFRRKITDDFFQKICGYKLITSIGFNPFFGNCAAGICMVTTEDHFTVGFTADRAMCPDTKVFVDILTRRFDKFLEEH